MAEEDGAGAEQPQANGNDTSPQVGFISQYVKDLSFENPNAPAVYQWQGQPKIEADFNIGAASLSEEIHEVTLRVEVRAVTDGQTAFAIDLLYAGLVGMRNVPEDQVQAFLLAEAPRILFPPLMLEPIDFTALYLQRAAQEAGEGGGSEFTRLG